MEIDDRVLAPRPAFQPGGLEDGSRKYERSREASLRRSQQQRIEFPTDVSRDKTAEASCGQSGIDLCDNAGLMAWVDVPKLCGH